MRLLDRARCPVKDSPDVAEAPCRGVRSGATPGVITEKLMKFRPLIGRLSICCCPTTDWTAVWLGSTTGPSAVTVVSSWPPATFIVKSISTSWPRRSARPSLVWVPKPETLTVTLYVPGGRAPM